MIEVVIADACISCDKCIEVCPTQVFDRGEGGIPVLARHSDCQTCYLCEAYCPTDALFVAPAAEPLPAGSPLADLEHLRATGLLGSYRAALGWGNGRTPTARLAVMPPLPRPTEGQQRQPAPGPAPTATGGDPP
jgi:NAD-dependent dihydropyrimidine dehydrogenase PreA subunit